MQSTLITRILTRYALLAISLSVLCKISLAQTQITTINTNAVTTGLTTSSYVATSPSDAGGTISASTSYTVNFGQVQNLLVSSYIAGGITYDNFVLPDTLIIRRTDAGRQLIIFYEYDNIDNTGDIIDLDAEQQDNEDLLYQSGLLNAGYDNILVNNATNFANVERIDILYNSGVVTSSPSTAVFPIIERGGNDDIRVAAVSSLDANGDPSGYYPTVVQINNNGGTNDWGDSGIAHLSLVMRRQDATSDPLPVQDLGSQNIFGATVSFSDFGVAADEIVYGYSIFANDVTVTGSDLVDFTNATNYPTNTGSDSGLDLIAGISTAVSSDQNLTRAKGPGGYKEALNTWLKANVGVTTATDGSNVTDWQDQWLGDHDATTLTTAPVYESDVVADINFNPTVDFLDATERGLQIANNTDFNTATSYSTKGINIAFRTGNDISTKQQIYEQGSNDRGINAYIRAGSLYVGAWNIPNTDGTGDDWAFNSTSTSSISTETEYILTIEFNGNSGVSGTVTAYLNGQSFGTIPNVGLLFADTDGIGLGDVNSASRYDDGTTAAASFYGSIPEFIYCDSPGSFSAAQRNRIESYLALKYGITLDQTTPINYVNSAGDIIFNTTNNASLGGYLEYNNDIAGIGRDDDSEFVQLSSQSENTGSIVQVDRNTAIGEDDTWLIWGNDGGATTASRIVSKPDTINERLQRVWRVAEENSVGVTDVSFDLTGLGFGTNTDDFSLLIARGTSGADFSSATVVTGGTFVGDVITFDDIDLSDGQYFTLGTQFFICTPGNVQDGLALWLKADAEAFNVAATTLATNGQTVEQWGDQSRNNFDANEDVNRNPTWIENDVNFNPGLNWNAGTDEIGFNLGSNYIFATAADGGAHIFSSVQPENTLTGGNRNNKWIVNFGNNNNDAYGIAAYGSRANIVAQGKVNFNISPSATNFIAEGDINTNLGTSDFKNFILDGTIVSTTTGVDIDLEDNASGVDEASTHGSNQGPVSIGRQSETNNLGNNAGRRFFGDMQEVIIYNRDITALQAQQVRSYLAIKYGTTLTDDNDADASPNETLGGAVVEGDYVASDGTTITFDYSDDTGFVTNVAGIGRDDDTCLEQRQSRSVNSDAILTVGLGEIAATNAANTNNFEDDLDFLTWGSDGASTAFGSITTAGTPGTVNERMLRIWRAQDTGDVGATDISFDLTGLTGYSTNAGDYQLIIAGGGDNTSLDAGTTVTGGTFNGSVLTFSGVDLTDGQYFTLGVSSDLCAPGGVTSNMVLWLRGDQGTSTTTDTNPLDTWTDQSTASNDGTETLTARPEFRNNSTDNINFLPTISFDGTDDRLSIGDLAEIKSVTGTGDYSMFGIGLRDDGSANYVIGSTGGTTNQDLHFGYRNSTAATIAHWGNDLDVTVSAFDSPNVPYLIGATYDGSTRTIEENRDDAFSRASEAETVDISGTQTNYIGDLESVGNYDGFISEVLVYNGAVTDLEKLRIYSYFGIKYGITLPQDNDNDATLNETISGSVAEGDLVASDGTTIIWDESNGYSTYHNGMAGIGRDDDACLNQKQSTSASDGTILTIGLDAVAADNAANTGIHDNLDFLVWGHDNVATDQTTAAANLTDLPSTVAERMRRVWRVEDTGTVGETEIQFDLTGLGYSSNAEDFRLIVSNSSTMADGSLTAGGTFNGSVLSFSGIDLTDGQYFTLGTALTTCGPGGVNTNIGLWLRADLEVFSDAGTTPAVDGNNVLQWNDQSSPAFNASEANGGGGSVIEPLFETNEINFNPVVFISDQNTTNNSYLQTAAASNTVDGDMTLIAIFETAQNQGADNQIDNTPSLIGAEDNTASDDYGLGVYQGEVVFNAANTNTFTARSTTTYNDGEPYMATGTRVQAASGAVNLYVNSLNVGTGTSDATLLNEPDSWAIGNQKDYDNEAQFQGNIGEVIVFDRVLSGEEQARVESYLGLKYGITRSDNTDGDGTSNEVISGSIREGDYVAGDGNVIWDYADRGAAYFNDIAGIGRDDLSCFDQTRSKSENNDVIVDIEISSFDSDDSWLIWGNDNEPIEEIRNSERPATINSRLKREWQVQETGTVGTVSVTFDLSAVTGTPLGDNNLTQVRMMIDTNDDFNSGVTLVSPTSIDAVAKTVTFEVDFNGTDGFYYTLGSLEVDALPVSLLSFQVESNVDHVNLEWTTVSEENNAFFTVERSTDGVAFKAIAQVDGAGTTSDIRQYSYTDSQPLSGRSFYRLKQTDNNGEFSYSPIESVFVVGREELTLKIMPNPATVGEEIRFEFELPEGTSSALLAVYDQSGKLLIEERLQDNLDQYKFHTDGLSQGLYFVRIMTNNQRSITKRFIVR